jgi:hypothetical protein
MTRLAEKFLVCQVRHRYQTADIPPPCEPFDLMNANILPVIAIPTLLSAPCSATDSDSDGIPADWEELRGTSDSDASDALRDWDGDGLTNHLEYLTQGRPWGNYTFHRLPWTALPVDLNVEDITGTAFLAANRSGEFVVNFATTGGTRSFLWTPPGGLFTAPELVEVPALEGSFIPFNDIGEVAITVTGGVDVRSLRDWNAGAAFVSAGTPYLGGTPMAAGLSNDGRVLFLNHAPISGDDWGTTCEWRDSISGLCSDLLLYEQRVGSPYGVAADTGGEAWFTGSSLNSGGTAFTGTYAAALPADGELAALTLPSGTFGLEFAAAADEVAVGHVHDPGSALNKAVFLSGSTVEYVEDGAAGADPVLFGVSDDGIVLGWNFAVSAPDGPFLWKGSTSVLLRKARLELETISIYGMSASGGHYALDFGDTSEPPQPVALQPAAPATGDGASDEGGALTDSDKDGIPDAREAAAGTSSATADTDGDGLADLYELLAGRDPATAESPASPGAAAGLAVHTPQSHPLRRVIALP